MDESELDARVEWIGRCAKHYVVHGGYDLSVAFESACACADMQDEDHHSVSDWEPPEYCADEDMRS